MTRVKLVLAALAASVLLAIPSASSAQNGGSVSAVLFGIGSAGKLVSETNVPVDITGQLTVAFHGSAAAGCASYGLCPYSGTIVVSPSTAQLAVEKFRIRRRIHDLAFLALNAVNAGSTTVADVQRSVPGQPSGLCADNSAPSFSISTSLHGGWLRLALLQAGGTLLSTRCAGPLDGDLASVGPQAVIPLEAVLRGRRTIDLSASNSFAAHGFAGTLNSTLVLRLGRPQSQSGQPTFPPGIKTGLVRTVIEHLGVVRTAGRLSATVQGSKDPIVCGLLDSCGLTGALTVGVEPHGAVGSLVATGPASRPYVDFLAALGLSRTGNRRGIQVGGGIAVDSPATVTSQLTRSGASCVDSAGTGSLAMSFSIRGHTFTAAANAFSGWRTRCPGPMVAVDAPILSGTPVPFAALGRRTFTVRLWAGGPLVDDGYSISPQGGLSLTIRRGRITQSVSTEPTG